MLCPAVPMGKVCQEETHGRSEIGDALRVAVHPLQIEERPSSLCVMSNGEPV